MGALRCRGLTPHQRQVLRLASLGLDNPEIAKKLNLSQRTVVSHFNAAYERLGARNRAHAVSLCYERGIFIAGGVR